jgi:hypothetical protein
LPSSSSSFSKFPHSIFINKDLAFTVGVISNRDKLDIKAHNMGFFIFKH